MIRVSRSLSRIVTLLLVSILNYRWGSTPRLAPRDQITTITHSEILGRFSLTNVEDTYRQWEHSERLWNEGKYFKSVEIKKNLLEKIYSCQEIEGVKQVPPFLSVGWGAAIGHIGSLGAFVLGQKLSIIPQNIRHLPTINDSSAEFINNFLQENVNLVSARHGFSILENPSQWHLSERLAVVRSNSEFISLYELHEAVYTDSRVLNQEIGITISDDYQAYALAELRKLGLPDNAWFVGVHIREKPNSLDPRVAKLNTFYRSISEIVGRGGWVIRFGADKMQPLPMTENVIDLNISSAEFRKLHLYIVAKSRFLLTTNSGPSVVAWALGTPVLQTNTLSIGRNLLSSSKGSIFLPKKYIGKFGQLCSFSQILGSTEAYAETDLREKYHRGFQLLDNSENEIFQATKDMFNFLNHGESDTQLGRIVDDIRRDNNAVGFGAISPSFLAENEKWFLR